VAFEWTEEVVRKLQKMWAAGHTASAIAKALKTTKNSVIGKVHRSGFKRGQPEKSPPADPYEIKRKQAARYIGLGELSRNECRYPVGKNKKVPGVHLFCGTPTDQKYSYCETHHDIVWKPAPVRVRVK
jgi:GcrA cell cycle regulator